MPVKYLIISILITIQLFNPPSAAAQNAPNSCGTNDSTSTAYLARLAQKRDLTRARAGAGQMLQYRLAFDINYNTYLVYNGDKERIMQMLHLFVRKASVVFEREMNIKLTIADVLIWDKPEPYQNNNDRDFFDNVNNYWFNYRPSANRDAVVGLRVGGGTFLGGFQILTSNFPPPEYENWEADILCHELGHSLGSPHTHNCSWPGGPIDFCEKLEMISDACPEGAEEYVQGTIMSYCRELMTFHPYCRNLIRDFSDGLVVDNFKLQPVGNEISQPGQLSIWGGASATPSFSWPVSANAWRYRLQIASDKSFTAVTEDTLVSNNFFTSVSNNSGQKYARYRIENEAGNGAWSNVLNFTVDAYSENTPGPLVIYAEYRNDEKVVVTFKPYAGTNAFEIEARNYYNGDVVRKEQAMSGGDTQIVPMKLAVNTMHQLRLRTRANNIWTRWSVFKSIKSPTGLSLLFPTDTMAVSAASTIAAIQYTGLRPDARIVNAIEVATDEAFRNIVSSDSVYTHGINEWQHNKLIFKPKLAENTRYYVRMHTKEPGRNFSPWTFSTFQTALFDSRVTFLDQPMPALLTNYYIKSERMQSQFYRAGNKLYIFSKFAGYLSTSDLKEWRIFTPATTAGRSPGIIHYFGASHNGDTYAMGETHTLVKYSEKGFQRWNPPFQFYLNDYSPLLASDTAGILFVSSSHGMGQFRNGQWSFFNRYQSPGQSNVPGFALDSAKTPWALEYPGPLWSFVNGRWKLESTLDLDLKPIGITFDRDNVLYAYGNGGVARWDRISNKWTKISQLSTFNVKKIVFDADNKMWVASYKWPDDYRYAALLNYALISFDGGKTNIYTEGLGIAREPFDIEFFNGKLVILTAGGELYTFDENKIQRFTPKESYLPGEKASLLITSLSPFGRDNQFTITLKDEESGATTPVTIDRVSGQELHFQMPDMPAGRRFRIQTHSTVPAINSNLSELFTIGAELPEIVLDQNKPNPSNTSTTISFYLPRTTSVELTLYNNSGQKIADLQSGNFAAGWHSLTMPVERLSPGVYIYKLKAGDFTKSLKMVRN